MKIAPTKVRYYEETIARALEHKKPFQVFTDIHRKSIPGQFHSSVSSSVKNANLFLPYQEVHASPRANPVRATVRSEQCRKSSTKEDSRDISIKTMRPPCRQSENLFDLEDSVRANKPIRIIRKQARPPSRHKTPPKALGLELPPNGLNGELHSMDSSPINQGLSMSQPIHFALLDDKKPQKNVKIRADSVKGKAINHIKSSEAQASRASSAKQNAKFMPVLNNKRKLESAQGPSNDPPLHADAKRSTSRVKQQNPTIFTNLQPEFLDLFA